MDTEIANRSVSEGTMSKVMEEVVEQLKPEAAYFAVQNGQPTCLMVFDMELGPARRPGNHCHPPRQRSSRAPLRLGTTETAPGDRRADDAWRRHPSAETAARHFRTTVNLCELAGPSSLVRSSPCD